MICEKCGAAAERSKGSQIPLGWSKIHLRVKRQKTDETDIRRRDATSVHLTKVLCIECSDKAIYSTFNPDKQSLTLSVEI